MKVTSGAIVADTLGALRREWRALAIWLAIHIAIGLGALVAFRPAMTARIEATIAGRPDTPLPPFGWLIAALAVVLGLLLFNAALRAVLQPETRRAAFLRTGRDEARLVALLLFHTLAFWLLLALTFLPMTMLAAIAARFFSIQAHTPAATVLVLMVMLLPFLLVGWAAIRLSPAAPLTLLGGKLVIGPAWRLTRGHVPALLGAYALIVVAIGLAYLALVAITMWPTIDALRTPDPTLRRWRLLLLERREWGEGFGRLALATIAGGALGGLALALHGAVIAAATRRLIDAGPSAYAAPPELREG